MRYSSSISRRKRRGRTEYIAVLSYYDESGERRQKRRISSDYTLPPDGCISYKTLYSALNALEDDLQQHIHLENNILFPRAVELEDMSCSI